MDLHSKLDPLYSTVALDLCSFFVPCELSAIPECTPNPKTNNDYRTRLA